jgi:hypothetical protein
MNRRNFLKTVVGVCAAIIPVTAKADDLLETTGAFGETIEDEVEWRKTHTVIEEPFVCKNSVTKSAAMNKSLGIVFHVDGQDDIIIPQAHIKTAGYSDRFYGRQFLVGGWVVIETSMILCGNKNAGNALSKMMAKDILVTLPFTAPSLYRMNHFDTMYVGNKTEYVIEICPV